MVKLDSRHFLDCAGSRCSIKSLETGLVIYDFDHVGGTNEGKLIDDEIDNVVMKGRLLPHAFTLRPEGTIDCKLIVGAPYKYEEGNRKIISCDEI